MVFVDNKHYENTPIQIYRKFYLQKLKHFQMQNSDNTISAQKHRLWVLVRTACEAVLTSTHNLCFEQK